MEGEAGARKKVKLFRKLYFSLLSAQCTHTTSRRDVETLVEWSMPYSVKDLAGTVVDDLASLHPLSKSLRRRGDEKRDGTLCCCWDGTYLVLAATLCRKLPQHKKICGDERALPLVPLVRKIYVTNPSEY